MAPQWQKYILKLHPAVHIRKFAAIDARLFVEPAIQPVASVGELKWNYSALDVKSIGGKIRRSFWRTTRRPKNQHGASHYTCECNANDFDNSHFGQLNGSADPRQLFAAEHVDNAVAADAALQDYRARGTPFNFAHSN